MNDSQKPATPFDRTGIPNWPYGHAVLRTIDGIWFVCETCGVRASDPTGMQHAA